MQNQSWYGHEIWTKITKIDKVTKIDKRNKTLSKKLAMASCQQIVMSLSFCQFMANLGSPRSQIPDA